MRCLATAVATATPPRTAAFACRWGEMKLIKGGIGRKKTSDEVQRGGLGGSERRRETRGGGEGKEKKKEKRKAWYLITFFFFFFSQNAQFLPGGKDVYVNRLRMPPDPPRVCPFIHHPDLSVLTLEESDLG